MAREFKYREVLKDKEYRKLLFSNLINRFGDSVDAIAFTWLIYQITHSASWAALIYGLNILPNIIVQPLLGPVVEKMNKKRIIISTHLVRGVVISAFALMYMAGIVNPYIMMAFTLLITSIESFNLPASGAFVPQVVNKEKLAHAMSLNTSLSSAVALVGTGAAGVIVAKLGVQTAMLIDVATFFLAAAFVMAIKTVAGEKEEMNAEEKSQAENAEANVQTANVDVIQNEAVETKSESYFSMLKDGIKYVAGNRVIVNYGILIVFLNFLLVPLNSIEAPIAEEVYGLGSELLSIMGMAASTGAILGSVITPIIMEKLSAKQIVITGGFTMGIFMYILSLGRFVYGSVIFGGILAGLCYFMMSAAGSVLGGSCMIRFVKMCDKEYLARAGAVMGATTAAAMPLGAIIVSIASATFNPAVLLSSVGILAIAFMTFVAFSNLDFELVGEEAADAASIIR